MEIAKARDGAPKFPARHRIIRLLWRIVWFFAGGWTPVFFRPWRIFLVRTFGGSVGVNSDIRRGCKIWYPPNLVLGSNSLIGPDCEIYNMNKIVIGDDTIISQRSFLCGGSHNINAASFELITKPIKIGNYCWVAAESFVGPGVEMGDGAVLGARGVAFGKLEDWSVYGGNPAVKIKHRRNFTK